MRLMKVYAEYKPYYFFTVKATHYSSLHTHCVCFQTAVISATGWPFCLMEHWFTCITAVLLITCVLQVNDYDDDDDDATWINL